MATLTYPPKEELTEDHLLAMSRIIAEDMVQAGFRSVWGGGLLDVEAVAKDLQDAVKLKLQSDKGGYGAYHFLTYEVLQDFIHWQGIGDALKCIGRSSPCPS